MKRGMGGWWAAAAVSVIVGGCSSGEEVQGGPDATPSSDASAGRDVGFSDAAPRDASPVDAGDDDAGLPLDAGEPADSGVVPDSGVMDAELPDTGPVDPCAQPQAAPPVVDRVDFPTAARTRYGDPTPAFGMAVAPLRANAGPDVVLTFDPTRSMSAGSSTTGLRAMRGDGTGSFSAGPFRSVAMLDNPLVAATGDFDGANGPDVVVAVHRDTTVPPVIVLSRNDGAGALGPSSERALSALFTVQDLLVGDFDEDGRDDLIVAAVVDFEIMLGEAGGLGPPTRISGDRLISNLQVADVNGDDHLDVVANTLANVTSTSDDEILVFAGDGAGGFAAPVVVPVGGARTKRVAVLDLDADQIPDMVAFLDLPGGSVAHVMIGDGLGGFTCIARIPDGGYGEQTIAPAPYTGDFDGDGALDLGLYPAGRTPTLDVYYGDGAGGFVGHEEVEFGTGVTTANARLADVDGDGRVDIVAAGRFLTRVNNRNVLQNLQVELQRAP